MRVVRPPCLTAAVARQTALRFGRRLTAAGREGEPDARAPRARSGRRAAPAVPLAQRGRAEAHLAARLAGERERGGAALAVDGEGVRRRAGPGRSRSAGIAAGVPRARRRAAVPGARAGRRRAGRRAGRARRRRGRGRERAAPRRRASAPRPSRRRAHRGMARPVRRGRPPGPWPDGQTTLRGRAMRRRGAALAQVVDGCGPSCGVSKRPPSISSIAVAVRIGDERDQRQVVAPAGAVGRLLGLHAELGEVGQDGLDVLDGDGEVVVAVAEVVGLLAADVHGQLEPVAVAGQAHVDVVGGLEVEPAALLEAEGAVEADGGVDVADADAGVRRVRWPWRTLCHRRAQRRPRAGAGGCGRGGGSLDADEALHGGRRELRPQSLTARTATG